MSEHNIPTRPGLKGVITSKGNTKTDETGTIIKYKTNLLVNVHNINIVIRKYISLVISAVDSRFSLFWSKYVEKRCDGPYRLHRY